MSKEPQKEEIIEEILSELKEENTITAGEEQELEIEDETWRRLSEGDPIKQAVWIKAVMERKGWNQKEASKERNLNISQPTLSRYLRLLELTPKLLDRVRKGDIAKTTAYKLSKLPREEQKKIEDNERITVNDAKDFYRKWKWRKNIKGEVEQALKRETPSSPITPPKEPSEETGEGETKEKETKNIRNAGDYLPVEVAANEKTPWADELRRKGKVICPHCGREITVVIEEVEGNG